MADVARPSGVTHEAEERAARYTPDYLRKLLIERHHIRAALDNPGGSVILTGVAATTEQAASYSPVIGNDFHLDLLDAEQVVSELPKEVQFALLAWADGMSTKQAAEYMSVRPRALSRRRERAAVRVAEEMSGARREDAA